MRCPVCHTEWQMPISAVSVRSNCPFCGADLVNVNVSNPMEGVLSAIYQQIGEAGMRNGRQLVSWFKDLAPSLQKEARSLSVFVKYNGHVELLDAKNSSDKNIISVATKIVSQMKEEPFPEEYACMVCEAFCKAIGIKTSLRSIQKQQQRNDKKYGIWAFAFAALFAVVIFGILLFFREKTVGIDEKYSALNSGDKTRQDLGYDASVNTKHFQAEWAEWTDKLPAYVTSANYTIEERTIYRSRHLETTSSTQGDTMEGWELYDSAVGNGDYGAWSAWQKEEISKTDSRDVETQERYRYRDKETTTSSSSTLQGWTLDDTTYNWGDYGSWSQWGTDKVSPSDSREVETKIQYRYRDKETTTSSNSSLSGWTQYDSSISWGDWGSWSSWSTEPVNQNDGRQVEQKTQYQYRDKEYKNGVTDANLSGWTQTNSYVVFGSWSSNKTTTSKPSESDTLRIVDQYVSGYNYFHYCCNYYDGGWMVDSIPYGNTNSTHYHTIRTTSKLSVFNMPDKGGRQAYGGYGTGAPACANNFYAWFLDSTEYTYVYQTRSATTLYDYARWGQWSNWSDSVYTQSASRQINTQTLYRYRDQKQIVTYYFYRWKEWSSWSATAVSESSNREVQTGTFYRYRDRASTPIYHFSRWKEWSSWSTSAVSQSSTRQVEHAVFYRYRERVKETTYYFRRWSKWSDYSEIPIEKSDTIEVEATQQYRYVSK